MSPRRSPVVVKVVVAGALLLLAACGQRADAVVTQHGDTWSFGNKFITVSFDAATTTFRVTDRRNGYEWGPGEPGGNRPVQVIARQLGQAPVIGGDPVAWNMTPTIHITPDMVSEGKVTRGARDLSAEASVAWCSAGLVLAVKVADDKVRFPAVDAREWWEQDSVEFWVGGEQFALRLGPKGGNLWRNGGGDMQAQIAWQRTADGYAVEALLPPATLRGLVKLQTGQEVPFALGINDADTGDTRKAQEYFPRTWRHSAPSTFARLVLADAAGNMPATRQPSSKVTDVKALAGGNGVSFHCDLKTDGGPRVPATVELAVEPDVPEVTVTINDADPAAQVHSFTALNSLVLDTAQGDIVCARYTDGLDVSTTDLSWRGQRWLTWAIDMPWVGVTDGNQGYMMLFEDPDNGEIRLDAVNTSAGPRLVPDPWHAPIKGTFGKERRVRYWFTNTGGVVAICKRYRRYAQEHGFLKTLREKQKSCPQLNRLMGAPDIWGAPDINFCREFKAAGGDRALVNATWSKADTNTAIDLGYLVSVYDNYEDVAEGDKGRYGDVKIPDDCPIMANGKPQLGWLTFDKKKQFYKRCSALNLQVAKRWIPPDQAEHPRDARFLDVTTATSLRECYSPVHPETRSDDRMAKRALANYVANDLKLVLGGEHGRWWGADIYDYWEGMMSGGFYSWPAGHVGKEIPQTRDQIGKQYLEYGLGEKHRVPLWELVFGDCTVSYWYWGDSTGHLYKAAPELADKKDCFNMLYGTLPLYWVNQPYSFNWNDPKLRARLLESYRVTCKIHEVTGWQEMTNYEYLTPDREVHRSTFADGTQVTVNFGTQPYTVKAGKDAYLLPQFGFYAKGPKVYQYRVKEGDRTITMVTSPGYLFCDAAGGEHDFGPVVTDGKVGLEKVSTDSIKITTDASCKHLRLRLREFAPECKGTVALVELDDSGHRISRLDAPRGDSPLTQWRPTMLLLWGKAAQKPDLAILAKSDKQSPAVPQQGEKLRLETRIANRGSVAARQVSVELYLGSVAAEHLLQEKRVDLAADSDVPVSFTIDMKRLDGKRTFMLAVDTAGKVDRLIPGALQTTWETSIRPNASDWHHHVDLRVSAPDGCAVPQGWPLSATVDLNALCGKPVDAASVRVCTLTDSGELAAVCTTQWNAAEKLVQWLCPAQLAGGATQRFRLLFDVAGGKGSHEPFVGDWWDRSTNTVTTPGYRITIDNGQLANLFSRLPGAPTTPLLTLMGVSSSVSGWTRESGTVQKLEVLDDGPVRTVVRVTKNLDGNNSYDKVYSFYPTWFTVETKSATSVLQDLSRAYYGTTCRFADDKGSTALIDGRGDGENVAGKNPKGRWYATWNNGWGLSCVALSPTSNLTYWDTGNMGGVGFSVSTAAGARFGYVLHGAESGPEFAAEDFELLSAAIRVKVE